MIAWKKPKYSIVFSIEQISQTILFDYLTLVDFPPSESPGSPHENSPGNHDSDSLVSCGGVEGLPRNLQGSEGKSLGS